MVTTRIKTSFWEGTKEVFSEIYCVGMLVLLSPFLILIGYVFLRDEMSGGNGE